MDNIGNQGEIGWRHCWYVHMDGYNL